MKSQQLRQQNAQKINLNKILETISVLSDSERKKEKIMSLKI